MIHDKEEKIRKAFATKESREVMASDSWKIFKIMSEFVNGFERMQEIGPCVSIFGSARTKPENKYYQLAEDIAFKLTQEGYGVITGGGPGIMEAANKGAKRGKGNSVGLNINLPFEQKPNDYIENLCFLSIKVKKIFCIVFKLFYLLNYLELLEFIEFNLS